MDYDTNIFMRKDSEFVSLQVITANCMKQFVRVRYTRKNLCQCANKKYQYQKFRITGLKSSLKATEKYAYCLDYLHLTSRYGFLKLNAAVLIDKTQKYRQEFFSNGRSYQKNWKEKLKRFSLMYVVRLFTKFRLWLRE